MDNSSFVLPKSYDPKQTDAKWYDFWEQGKFFIANNKSSKEPYTIVMPPPNVTGVLHMGHALVSTLQDVLVRWKRMCGYETLWIPGTDHAGIATQTVVERHLLRTEGKRRKDYSRNEFLEIVWGWKESKESEILGQLKKLGCSCDWSRTRFTMDKTCNKAVRHAFKKFFDKGYIYRGDYLVNWDPVTQTALADDEVEYEEKPSFLWFFKYPFADGSGHAIIATTRPETMLGDVALAVSPKDARYKHWVGRIIEHPITHRKIPIIADSFVDPTFGSGIVKITPAHDPNDYKIGLTHRFPLLNIMTPDARINEMGGDYAGMTREEARLSIIQKMKSLGLVEKIEPHLLRVGVSYRSKAILEPYLSKQWFVKMEPFIKPLQEAVSNGEVKLIPSLWENTYFHWINNLRDWCISRQLWWGHQIPVWYSIDDPNKMICYAGEGVPPEVEQNPHQWVQDDDVLDTWFSSGLWPLATLGWPEVTDDFKRFYPTSVLITGHDILFFWVARMLLMGKELTGSYPFPESFLHGLIYGKSYWRNNLEGGITYVSAQERKEYDTGKKSLPPDVESKWEKLSKSKGNVIDPLELIEEYGTDAMRMALCATANQTPQIDLDRRRFEDFRNFANKLWNGARFVFLNLEGLTTEELISGLSDSLVLEDLWILSSMNRVNKEVNQSLSQYFFDQAASKAYDFFWKEFCAYYVEIAKPILFRKTGSEKDKKNKQKLLVIILCNCIRLLHPMAPFITEELFQLLKNRFADLPSSAYSADPYTQKTLESLLSASCMIAPFPQVIRESDIHPKIDDMFSLMEDMIYTIRNIRGEMKIPPNIPTSLIIETPKGSKEESIILENQQILSALVPIAHLEITPQALNSAFSTSVYVRGLKLIIPLPEELKDKERARLLKEKDKLEDQIRKLKIQLADTQFMKKAKPELVARQEQHLIHSEGKLSELQKKLEK